MTEIRHDVQSRVVENVDNINSFSGIEQESCV